MCNLCMRVSILIIVFRFKNAKKPVILVDVCCGRFGMETTVRKLVEECGIWFYDSQLLLLASSCKLADVDVQRRVGTPHSEGDS